MVHVSMESFFLLCIIIVGTHVRYLRVTISQNHVGHEHTRAYLKSNAVKLNFHLAPHACWSVCLGTVDTNVVLGQSPLHDFSRTWGFVTFIGMDGIMQGQILLQ